MDILSKEKELLINIRALTIDCKNLDNKANNLLQKIQEINNLALSGALNESEIANWNKFTSQNEEYEKLKRLILVLQYVEHPEEKEISNALLNNILDNSIHKSK